MPPKVYHSVGWHPQVSQSFERLPNVSKWSITVTLTTASWGVIDSTENLQSRCRGIFYQGGFLRRHRQYWKSSVTVQGNAPPRQHPDRLSTVLKIFSHGAEESSTKAASWDVIDSTEKSSVTVQGNAPPRQHPERLSTVLKIFSHGAEESSTKAASLRRHRQYWKSSVTVQGNAPPRQHPERLSTVLKIFSHGAEESSTKAASWDVIDSTENLLSRCRGMLHQGSILRDYRQCWKYSVTVQRNLLPRRADSAASVSVSSPSFRCKRISCLGYVPWWNVICWSDHESTCLEIRISAIDSSNVAARIRNQQ